MYNYELIFLKLQDFKLNPKCNYLNGHRIVKDSWCGVGKRPIDVMSSAYAPDNPEAVEYIIFY